MAETLKNSASTLGLDFKEDIHNINNGHPILIWQDEVSEDNNT